VPLSIKTKCAAGTERQPKGGNHEASDGEDRVFFGFRVGLQEEYTNPQQDDPKQEDACVAVHDVVP
jgi:hypothetical protein